MTAVDALPLPDLETYRLAYGSHPDRSNGLCALELVAWMAGEAHSDHPACADVVIAAFVRRLNDRMDDENRQLLKPYLPRLIGTANGPEIQRQRAFVCADYACRVWVPIALRAAGLEVEAARMAALPMIAAWSAAKSAESAAWSAAKSAAWSAAWSAWSAWSAEYAAWSAEYAAWSAWSAEYAAESAGRSAWSAGRSASLSAESASFAAEAARSAAASNINWQACLEAMLAVTDGR